MMQQVAICISFQLLYNCCVYLTYKSEYVLQCIPARLFYPPLEGIFLGVYRTVEMGSAVMQRLRSRWLFQIRQSKTCN